MVLSTKKTINSLNTNTDISISHVQRQGDEERVSDEQELLVEGGDDEHCVICLHEIRDRTILPCAHDRLCFECIFVWCQQSRKCPLCNAPIGPYLIHNFRSDYDYSKHYLPPLRTSPVPPNNVLLPSTRSAVRPSRNREQVSWGRRRNAQTSQERKDELELAISRRRWIYPSNSHTRYRPAPTPAQFSNSQDTISRATIFIRRELRVWINLDVEFLTTFILSLMKSIDIRSESAVKLLAEFLDMDISYHVGETDQPSRERFPNAEHFAHELYSYLRSPFKDLTIYDRAVQYEIPSDIPPPPDRPIPNRYERHWETTTTHDAIAESSRHAPHHLRNSHSPHLRSPKEEEGEEEEEALSPSPSPPRSDSYDNFYYNQQYRYRPVTVAVSRAPPRESSPGTGRPGPSSSSFRDRRDYDDNRLRENNRNEKGKGKGKVRTVGEEIPSKHDSDMRGGTWKSKSKDRVDIHHRTTATRKRERSVSFEQEDEEEYLTRKKSPFQRDVNGSSSYQSSHQQQQEHQRQLNLTEHEENTSKSADTGTSDRRQVEIPAAAPSSTIITDQQPEIPVHPSWGISIKGQAKLQLGGFGGGDELEEAKRNDNNTRLLSGSSRISLLSVDDDKQISKDPNDTISQSRLRKPSELLHAHLLRNSSTAAVRRTTNELDASNSRGSSGSGSSSSSSPATVVVVAQNNYNNNNNNNNTEIGIDLKEENERRTFTSSSINGRDLEVAPQQTETQKNNVQSSKVESILPTTATVTARRMSARDIMIRTRARLAKMRNEQDPDLMTTTTTTMVNIDDADTSPSNTMSEIRPSPPTGVGVGGAVTVGLSATVRAYLLKQLEEEKKKLISRNSGKRDDGDGDVASSTLLGRRRLFDTEPGGGMDNEAASEGRPVTGGISIGKDHHHHHQDLITKEEALRARLLSRKSETREVKEG